MKKIKIKMKRPYENIVQDFKMTATILLINHFVSDEQLTAERDPEVLSQSLALFTSRTSPVHSQVPRQCLFS